MLAGIKEEKLRTTSSITTFITGRKDVVFERCVEIFRAYSESEFGTRIVSRKDNGDGSVTWEVYRHNKSR